jgi:hypothetical protein
LLGSFIAYFVDAAHFAASLSAVLEGD